MNALLAASDLTCAAVAPGVKRCVENLGGDQEQENARGYLGKIQLSYAEDGRYLLVKTDLGIRCGYDQSLYVYERREKVWGLLLKSEQNEYGENEYKPQNFLTVAVSPPNGGIGQPAPPPLILTLGFSPWCQSNWQAIYTRLWRASLSTPSPKPLIDAADDLYMGDDPAVAEGSVTQTDAVIEYRGRSIDAGVLVRPIVRHYLVHDRDKVERVAPLALSPEDFVGEWLTTKWEDVAKWPDLGGATATLARWHRSLHKAFVSGEIDAPLRRCRADHTLWQVGVSLSAGDEKAYRTGAPVYFLVRWTAPYRFTLLRARRRPYPNCNETVQMPDNLGTLFPLQDWRR